MTIQRNRGLHVALVVLTIVTGLVWRSKLLPLTPFLSKYGGDALWAMVVFFGFGVLFPKMAPARLAILSLGFAWGIEFLQLYHEPWIDAIRARRIGLLVLGTTFNWPDLPAYAVGVGLAVLADVLLAMRSRGAQFRS